MSGPDNKQRKSASKRAPVKGKAASGSPAKKGAANSAAAAQRAVTAHSEIAVATRLMRDAYTRERHYFLMRTVVVLSALLFVSVSGNVYQGVQPTQYKYFATNEQGDLKELQPLNTPVQSKTALLNWVTNSITDTYTLSFANYQKELQDAASYFTTGGWKNFEKAIGASGFLPLILDDKFVTTAVPRGAPVIVAQGDMGGRYAWKVQIPILVTFESAKRVTSREYMVTALVVRRPQTENPVGLGIAQILAE